MYQKAALVALLNGIIANAFPGTQRSNNYQVKEHRAAPPGWTANGEVQDSEIIQLQLALRQGGDIESHLQEVSDPRHARYGHHLSAAEVHDLITPSVDTIHLVETWLAEHGIAHHVYNPAKDWITVSVPVRKAEQMLDATYTSFQHDNGAVLHRTTRWSLPAHLHKHIDDVQPTTSFFGHGAIARDSDVIFSAEKRSYDLVASTSHLDETDDSISVGCKRTFLTPQCLRTLYGTINYKTQAVDQNSIAIVSYLNQTSIRADIQKFLKRFRPEAAAVAKTFPITIVDGAENNQTDLGGYDSVEADLDVEQAIAISWPTPFEAINVGGEGPGGEEAYLNFLNYILARKNVPRVISTSYGEDERTVPEAYAKRVCNAFAQLGARGVTVLFSSGDYGVGGSQTRSSCVGADGKKHFVAHFPASCPWVTAVGATELKTSDGPEIATQIFGSGGGFSNYFTAPKYQQSTVSDYITGLNGKYDGYFNKGGRGFPDVSAQGAYNAEIWGNETFGAGGTSASTPLFAGVIALVNDALLAKGKPALGFLNPLIYGGGYEALTDITIGTNSGCRTKGFSAKGGWDPLTGWGTPNFGKLVDYAMKH